MTGFVIATIRRTSSTLGAGGSGSVSPAARMPVPARSPAEMGRAGGSPAP